MIIEQDRPDIGHNNPPTEAQIAVERFEAAWAARPASTKILEVEKVADQPVDDEDAAARAVDAVKAARSVQSAAKLIFDDVVEPHQEAVKSVRAKRDAIEQRAHSAKAKLERKINDFRLKRQAEENARLAAERERQEALRKAEPDAAQEPAPAPPAPKVAITGNYGAKATTRTDIEFEIVDFDLALAVLAQEPEVREGLEKALRRITKVNNPPPIMGVKYTKTEKVIVK